MAEKPTLTLVAPVPVTDPLLVSSDVPETEPEWAAGTTYAKGARARLGHVIYQSAIDANIGRNPATDIEAWTEVGPSNRWAAFDGSVSTKTHQAGNISYRLKFGRAITSVNVLETDGATSVRVRVVDPTYGAVYDRTISMAPTPRSSSWWQWFFGQRNAQYDASFNDLPTYPNADILVDIVGTADLAVGVILFGNAETYTIGVRYGASVGIQDYSRKERNDFGDTTLVRRAYARRANFTMVVPREEVDALMRRMSDLRAVPCLWSGSGAYDAMKVYGFYKDFDLVIQDKYNSIFTLSLEGLT